MRKVFTWRPVKRDPMAKLEYLQRVDVFKGLSRNEVERFGERFPMRECSRGTVLFTPDDPTERMFVLKEGHVELYRLTAGGKRLVTRRLGPGSIFGEMGLLGQTMQGEFAEATEEALVCSGTREDVLDIFREHPDVAARFMEVIGRRLKMLEDRLEHAVFSGVPVRLAAFILANADPSSGMVSGFTHAEIGDTIGALRQTVTESLGRWRDEGLIAVGHKLVEVKDWERLREKAASEEVLSR